MRILSTRNVLTALPFSEQIENNKQTRENILTISFNRKNGQILCFDGDLKHRPQLCFGFGCRDSIVVFIKYIN